MPHNEGLTLLANLPDMEAEIGVDFLARCYGDSWNPATYHWYLKREFHGETPDRLVLAEAGRVLATAGIGYRQLRTPDGTTHRVGIMIAACVPPEQRGRGRFVRLWKGAVNYCATRDCTALLGFVTADNASCLILRRAGAVQIPSSYVISEDLAPGSTALPGEVVDVASSAWRDYADAALQSQQAAAGFHYPDRNAWRSQFIDRPYPVALLRIGDASRAVVEHVSETDRLQWLDAPPEGQATAVAALVDRARRAQRRFFMYSMTAPAQPLLRDCGLTTRPGFMMAQATRAEHQPVVRGWVTLRWRVQSGDRL
jgi:hypothetical protein